MIFNMVGGGGGGLKDTDAVLIVSVPTGSTVTATKDTTLTPTMWVQNADNTLDSAIFSIPSSTFDANAWTVTATLGADSASDTIVINSNEEFEMELSYGFFLYNKGTIETSVSGGLSNAYSSGASPTRTAESTYYYVKGVGTSGMGSNGTVATINAIDLTNYSLLVGKLYDITINSCAIAIGATSSRSTSVSSFTAKATASVDGSETLTVDISGLTGNYYIAFGGGGPVNKTWEFKLSELFLKE